MAVLSEPGATRPARPEGERVTHSVWTKIAYGVGAIPYGVKGNGFSYFLLLFYSQALGVPKEQVGLAIFITFLCDALSDPVVGFLSDKTNTRWGRRHPYMYAAAAPVAIAYWFLWNPPIGASNETLFWYLLACAIAVRLLITFYEVPSTALVAEFTSDYDQRSVFLSYRNLFGWIGGVAVAVITLGVLLDSAETGSGFTDVSGFRDYGLMAAVIIFMTIVISGLGTHRTIPHLRKTEAVPAGMGLMAIFREVYETLSNRSFAALFAASFFAYVASGLSASLTFYIYGYFWGFTTDQAALITTSVVVSALIAFVFAPYATRRFGKKRAALGVGMAAFTIAPTPIILRLFGLMPANSDPILFPLIFSVVLVDLALIITVQILVQSMIADLVEDGEMRTNRRSEGLFFASITFTRKAVEGGGILLASTLLLVIGFPEGAAPADVSSEAIFRLGAFYAPTQFSLWMLMLVCLAFYRIDRSTHEANVQELAARASVARSGAHEA